MTWALTLISVQGKPEVRVCAGQRPVEVIVHIRMTWHIQVRLTRWEKHISLQFSLFVKFLPTFNLFAPNHPKLLAERYTVMQKGAFTNSSWQRQDSSSWKNTLLFLWYQHIKCVMLLTFKINQTFCLKNLNNIQI